MGVLRRISALATGLLVLQLTLLGAAAPCTDHGAAGLSQGDRAMSSGTEHDAATATGSHEDCDGAPAEPGQSEPASGSCIAMISCVAPMLQFGAELSVDGGNVITTPLAAAFLEPPTRTTAPELPPPRA